MLGGVLLGGGLLVGGALISNGEDFLGHSLSTVSSAGKNRQLACNNKQLCYNQSYVT